MNETYLWAVPEFERQELAARFCDYCVCLFVLNEGARLHAQLRRMKELGLAQAVDIVIADGGSTDGSVAPDFLREMQVNTLLIKRGPGKLGSQMRMAFAWALRRGYRGVVVIDGNNKDGVEAIPSFIDLLRAGYDHIQGSRFIPCGHHENTPLSRYIGLKILHAPLMRACSGFPYTDTTNGFRAYSARFLADKRLALFRDVFAGYELHYYLARQAPRLGFRCTETPVSRIYPATGKTPTKISPIRGNLAVLQKLCAVARGAYDPPPTSL